MPEALLLAIDLGTSSVKVAATTTSGRLVATGTAEYPILHPQPGHAEQDPAAWWEAIVTATHKVTDALDPGRIQAIGLSGQMHGTVLLDEDNVPLGNAIIWPDQRSAQQVAEITESLGAEQLIAITGSPVATGFQAASIRWIQAMEPARWRRAAMVLLPKDYIRWRLTGQFATDPSDGSGALLLDVRTRDWSDTLLERLAIARRQLPPVQPASARAGSLLSDAAAALGLPPAIPVFTGAADTACSALAAGAVSPGTLLLTLSTGGQLVLPVAEPVVDPRGRIHTFCGAFEPGRAQAWAGWYQMGAILSAGMTLRWLRDQVFGLTGEDAYARMSDWAQASAPGANGLLFLPYLAGERTPHMDPRARGAFLGLTLSHAQGDLVRAVMEGVAFAALDALQVLIELGAAPGEIVLAGGGARSPVWRQIVADASGLPVRPLQVSEQSAVGACLLAGLGAGLVDAEMMAATWTSYGEPTLPRAEWRGLYAARHAQFRSAYRNNRDLFGALGATTGEAS
jgi:xylulokinase